MPACCDCDCEFNSLPELLKHYDTNHIPGSGTELNHHLICPYCLRSFTVDSNYASHIELHEFESPLFSCETCTKCFKSKRLLQFHQGHIFHKCSICLSLVSSSHISNHLEKHRRSQLYECTNCSSKIAYEEISHHMKLHNSEAGIVSTCDECAKAFPSRKNYSLHMKRGHDTYPCDICLAVVFNSKEEWDKHRQIHFAGSFPCSVCHKVFTEEGGLKNHQNICFHHSNGLSKSRNQIQTQSIAIESCSFCPRTLKSRKEMKIHICSEHTDLLAYQCPDCSEISFGRQEYLIHKQNSHPLKCQVCNSEYTNNEEFNSHLSTHKQARTEHVFCCEFCEATYKNKESLFNHKISHSQYQDPPNFPKVQTIGVGHSRGRSSDVPQQRLNYHQIQLNKSLENFKGNVNMHVQNSHNKTTVSNNSISSVFAIPPPHPINILYRCKSCNLLFRGDDKFQEHKKKVHQANSNLTCKLCNCSFQTTSDLKQHQLQICVNKSDSMIYKPHRCLKCHKEFMLEASLQIHQCSLIVKQCTKKSEYIPDDDTDVTFVLTIA